MKALVTCIFILISIELIAWWFFFFFFFNDTATTEIYTLSLHDALPIVEALAGGADVVITGRVADSSLFLAPLVHELGWRFDDWTRLARGAIAGHLLECAGQITGGYFADPGYKDVAGLARLGFPIGEVLEDGSIVITKLQDT